MYYRPLWSKHFALTPCAQSCALMLNKNYCSEASTNAARMSLYTIVGHLVVHGYQIFSLVGIFPATVEGLHLAVAGLKTTSYVF